MASQQRVVDSAGARRADLAAIHIAKATLQLSDDEYRDLMASVCGGIRSSGDLDFAGRKRWLSHLQECVRNTGKDTRRSRTRPPLTARQGRMWSLWMQLADAGLVQQRKWSSLESFAQRQTGVDKIEWLNSNQEDLVIDSLKAWLGRRRQPERSAG